MRSIHHGTVWSGTAGGGEPVSITSEDDIYVLHHEGEIVCTLDEEAFADLVTRGRIWLRMAGTKRRRT